MSSLVLCIWAPWENLNPQTSNTLYILYFILFIIIMLFFICIAFILLVDALSYYYRSRLAYFLFLGAALLLPVVAASVITYRKLKNSSIASSDPSDEAEKGTISTTERNAKFQKNLLENSATPALSLDISSHSTVDLDASNHSATEAISRNSGSFSSYINAPSVFLNNAKTRFSELQQSSPMRTPEAPARNPMTAAPDVAI
jgi:hypothetical protein